MRTSISLPYDQSLVFKKSSRTAAYTGSWISGGRYLGLAALGVLLAVVAYAALTTIAEPARFQILAALAAGMGLVQVWEGFDNARLGRALTGIVAGGAVIVLAIAALPVDAGLLAGAFLTAGLTAAVGHNRETGLWVPAAALALTLAVLSLA